MPPRRRVVEQRADHVAGQQTSWERDSERVDDIRSACLEKTPMIATIATCTEVLVLSLRTGHDEKIGQYHRPGLHEVVVYKMACRSVVCDKMVRDMMVCDEMNSNLSIFIVFGKWLSVWLLSIVDVDMKMARINTQVQV